MRFQSKLIIAYLAFIIFLIIILGGIFYRHSTMVFQENAYSNITVIADKISQQLENIIQPMDFKTAELLSDESIISSLTSLGNVDRNQTENLIYINEARRNIYSKLITYSIDKNFYRVSFFNNNGDFLTSNFRMQDVNENIINVINNLSWKRNADSALGKITMIPPYKDPWAADGIKVFGVARSIQWPRSGMGYIEIQKSYVDLQKIFEVPDQNSTKVIAITDAGEFFYSDDIEDRQLLEYYSSLAASLNKAASVKKNNITGKDEIVAGVKSAYTGLSIIIAQDKTSIFKPLSYTARATLIIAFIIIIISFVYIYIFSRQLTKPIRQLKYKIEDTELENLPEKIIFENSHNEIEALNNSFQRLRERLNEAVRREIKSQSLQMKANFDSLQAQVNPHFIYNILNVLSNKGIENGDDEICEICDSIAAMLRYSTSTLNRSATISEELEHVKNYLLLMKKRYEHRLEFDFEIDESIYGEKIPKIVLQQIVENSVNHCFKSGQKIVKIQIRGYVSGGFWYIEFTDNGSGFEEAVLKELEKRMEAMKRDLIIGEQNTGLSIGGMGLINTYGRLMLFYKNKFIFTLKNDEFGGAKVTIGSIVGISEEEYEK
jgi:two-component system sensor histidine kinase YesM